MDSQILPETIGDVLVPALPAVDPRTANDGFLEKKAVSFAGF